MTELTVKELDLLERVKAKAELRPLFFKKVKGLKWFNALHVAGYFDAQHIPAPKPAKQEGYFTIPRWEILEYLVKTVPELTGEAGEEYAPRFLEIIANATAYARDHEFGNYHAWWQCAEIVSQIPFQFISLDFLDAVDYWLDDKFEKGLVADAIGCKWLVKLLKEEDAHALALAANLLEILYKTSIKERERGDRRWREASFRFDYYYADKITRKVAFLAGQRLGRQAASMFQLKLEDILETFKIDSWSATWQPAIEDHEQNKHHDDPENVLIGGFRETLNGYFEFQPKEACEYVAGLLGSAYQTVQRLAIYCIGRRYDICKKLADLVIDQKYLHANFRHEVWHFFNRNYPLLDQNQKDRIIELIKNRKRLDEDGTLLEAATAYEHATWLAAIKDAGANERELYGEAAAIAKAEPAHPDFSSYRTSGVWGHESPYSVEELGALSIDELVQTLATYKGRGGWQEPGVEGLVNAVKQLIKKSPLSYYNHVSCFHGLDLAYIYAVIEAYSELWNEKVTLPWDDVWRYLLAFFTEIVEEERFWSEENAKQREDFVANRFWIVGAIGRLLEAGAKSDEHAFDEKYHNEVESLIAVLLEREKGEEFTEKSDAVSVAINSPRGHCIEALINLTLRACRLSDRVNNKDHSEVWKHFQHYYEAELKRSEKGEYEFATLVTNYLPNFLYMSGDWVRANLEKIFDQTDYLKWLCAIQGYSYIGTVYQEIYCLLRDRGDLLRVLDDENLKDRVAERAVQQIVIAYLNDFESLTESNSLIRSLIERRDHEELSQLIWFVWTLRKDDCKLRDKVYALWPMIVDVVDFSSNEGKKLASSLCHWAAYVDHLDQERKTLLLAIAPYAEESHNSHDLLKSLANLSDKQPFDVNEIWLKVLEGSAPDFPEEAIRQMLTNFILNGDEGIRMARETVSEYLKHGNERPTLWLREIMRESLPADPHK